MELKAFKICRIRCRCCGSILEYKNRSKTDCGAGRMMVCNCGSIGLDPAALMYRIACLKTGAEYEDLSEPWEDD